VDYVSPPSDSHAAKWILVVLLALLAVCVGARDPASAIATGMDSIDAARSAGAARLAPQPLAAAIDKLERARALQRAGRSREAVRLAEQASDDARMAQTTALAAQRHGTVVMQTDDSARPTLQRVTTGRWAQP
jgi:hypothetical protein